MHLLAANHIRFLLQKYNYRSINVNCVLSHLTLDMHASAYSSHCLDVLMHFSLLLSWLLHV